MRCHTLVSALALEKMPDPSKCEKLTLSFQFNLSSFVSTLSRKLEAETKTEPERFLKA